MYHNQVVWSEFTPSQYQKTIRTKGNICDVEDLMPVKIHSTLRKNCLLYIIDEEYHLHATFENDINNLF
jgi:hypothetical protein